jgi:SP family myo-inositol transporter-like MFS transporter 13
MAASTDDKKTALETSHQEHLEEADLKKGDFDEQAALSSIEDTAASKAAWLITLTVSLGGFLFGSYLPAGLAPSRSRTFH